MLLLVKLRFCISIYVYNMNIAATQDFCHFLTFRCCQILSFCINNNIIIAATLCGNSGHRNSDEELQKKTIYPYYTKKVSCKEQDFQFKKILLYVWLVSYQYIIITSSPVIKFTYYQPKSTYGLPDVAKSSAMGQRHLSINTLI